jgi:HK97 family phage major capsid protein
MASRSPEPPGRFSLLALLACSSYESGLSKIAADRYGQPQARGLAVPHARMVRDLGVGAATSGGNLASGQQIQAVAAAVQPALVLEQMGAQRIEVNATGEVLFPRWTGGNGGWLSESESSVSDSAAIDSVTASPKCAAARLAVSRRLRNQSREDIEAAVLAELGQCVAATLEAGFLTGLGVNEEPLGLIYTPGIGMQAFSAATPTLADLVGMVETYGDADGDLAAARWLLNPSDLADLLKAQVDADGGELIVQYIDGAHRICGLPVFSSRHMPEGKHVLMDPSAVATVFFGPAQVVLDEYSNGKAISGAAEIVVFNFADVVVKNPALIVVGAA